MPGIRSTGRLSANKSKTHLYMRPLLPDDLIFVTLAMTTGAALSRQWSVSVPAIVKDRSLFETL